MVGKEQILNEGVLSGIPSQIIKFLSLDKVLTISTYTTELEQVAASEIQSTLILNEQQSDPCIFEIVSITEVGIDIDDLCVAGMEILVLKLPLLSFLMLSLFAK